MQGTSQVQESLHRPPQCWCHEWWPPSAHGMKVATNKTQGQWSPLGATHLPGSKGEILGPKQRYLVLCEMLWDLRANYGAARIYQSPEPAGRAPGGQVGSCRVPKQHQAPTFRHLKCPKVLRWDLGLGCGISYYHHRKITPQDSTCASAATTDLNLPVSGKGQHCHNPSSAAKELEDMEMKSSGHGPGSAGCLWFVCKTTGRFCFLSSSESCWSAVMARGTCGGSRNHLGLPKKNCHVQTGISYSPL